MTRAYYQLFLHDKNGKLVWKSKKKGSKSFVLQWLQIIMAHVKFLAVANGKDITGTVYTIRAEPLMRTNGGAGETAKGTVVGTGIGAEANDNYALGALISHGVGAGQLQYGSQAFTDPAIVAGNVDAVLTRAFTNGSGATVTVKEIGVYTQAYESGGALKTWLILRDVLPSPVDVPNGQTLTVQYTLRTTV